jgi:predicted RNA-binding Zn ribbon-like protein
MKVVTTESDETVLLALLNSAPVVDGVRQDALADPASAGSWLRSHVGTASGIDPEALRDTRDTLQAVIRGSRSPASLAPLLDGVSCHPTVSDTGVFWTLDVEPGRSVGTRAVLAWDALRTSSPGRLRPCANPECELFLIDRSKPNTARWCSMAVCGNRMKARRHYQRTRDTDESRPATA